MCHDFVQYNNIIIFLVNKDDSRKELNLSFVDLYWTTAHPIQLQVIIELCGADKKEKVKHFQFNSHLIKDILCNNIAVISCNRTTTICYNNFELQLMLQSMSCKDPTLKLHGT